MRMSPIVYSFPLTGELISSSCLEELGRASYSKSHTGAADFAKSFIVRNLTKALLNAHHPYGLMAVHLKYCCARFTTLCAYPIK